MIEMLDGVLLSDVVLSGGRAAGESGLVDLSSGGGLIAGGVVDA